MLAIEVEWLGGRYYAGSHANRDSSDWPPAPARLFAALVDTACAGPGTDTGATPEEAAALTWLEAQGDPGLTFSDASERDSVVVFVPENNLKPLTARPDSPKKARDADPTLDPRAARKERRFPSVTLDDPRAVYQWPQADAPESVRAALKAILGRTARLGHPASLVRMRLLDAPPSPTWVPDPAGPWSLRTLSPGQFDRWQRDHARHVGLAPRQLAAPEHRWRRAQAELGQPPASAGFSARGWWLRWHGPVLPARRSLDVARAVRGALFHHAGGVDLPPWLSGHDADGGATADAHLAVVPIPWVGHRHADGRILGVALFLPDDGSANARFDALGRLLYAWREGSDRWAGGRLQIGPTTGTFSVVSDDDLTSPTSLRAGLWVRPAKRFTSVLPIALPRYPKNPILGRRPRAGEDAAALDARVALGIAEAREILVQAAKAQGLPEPSVEILAAPVLSGAPHAAEVPPLRQGDRLRVHVHADLTFGEPLRGPVLLGSGRFFGYGLTRPLTDREGP